MIVAGHVHFLSFPSLENLAGNIRTVQDPS